MRHRVSFRKLSRTHEHRRAMLRNLVTSLFLHERVETSVAKAKEARRVAERMITFAKRGDLSARRHVDSYLFDEDATRKLFDTIAPWYKERAGGYTRIVRVGRRLGDAGEMAIFELVKTEEQRAADRKRRIEAAEAKELAKSGKGAPAKAKKKGEEAEEEAAEAPAKGRGRGRSKVGAGAAGGRGGKRSAPAAPGKAPQKSTHRKQGGE
ncbi:MAG: 50S ribosomal protein L17 [Candidatus Eiseniibacteriota bacterium]